MAIFTDGQIGSIMETLANFSAWTDQVITAPVTLVVSSAGAHHGTNSVLAIASGDGGQAIIRKTIPAQGIVHLRLYVKITGSPGTTIILGKFGNTAWGEFAEFGVTSSRKLFVEYFTSSWNAVTSATGLNLNQWYCIEVLCDTTNRQIQVWLDGTQVADLTRTGLSLPMNLNLIGIGLTGTQTGEVWGTATVYEDCIAVDSSYIGPEGVTPTTITLNVVAGANGTVNVLGAQVLAVGEIYRFTATAFTGYVFDHWTLNGTVYTANPLDLPITVGMNGKALTALFRTLGVIYDTCDNPSNWGSLPASATIVADTVDYAVADAAHTSLHAQTPADTSFWWLTLEKWHTNGLDISTTPKIRFRVKIPDNSRILKLNIITGSSYTDHDYTIEGLQSNVWQEIAINLHQLCDEGTLPILTQFMAFRILYESKYNAIDFRLDQIEFESVAQHNLTINSTPLTNVPYTIDEVARTTSPSSFLTDEGYRVIAIPATIVVGTDNYRFAQWNDGNTNSTRTINLITDTSLTATYTLYTPPITTGALHVDGKYIKDTLGNVVVLRGVNRNHFHDCSGGAWGGWFEVFNSVAAAAELDELKNVWGVNCLRLITAINYWKNNTAVTFDGQPSNHRTVVKAIIQMCAERGIYVIWAPWDVDDNSTQGSSEPNVGLPFPPYYTGNSSGVMTIASVADFAAYWVSVSNELKGFDNVIYDLWNEPHCDTDAERQNAWYPAWVQVINAIRANNDQHLIILEYNNWNSVIKYLDWALPPLSTGSLRFDATTLINPSNLIYSTHLYRAYQGVWLGSDSPPISDYTTIKQRLANLPMNKDGGDPDWGLGLKPVADIHPVIVGEIGAQSSNTTDVTGTDNALRVFNEWGVGYAAWIFMADGTSNNLFSPGPTWNTSSVPTLWGQKLMLRIAEGITPLPSIIISPTGPVNIVEGDTVSFTSIVSDGTGVVTVVWYDALGSELGTSPSLVIAFPAAGTYYVHAVVTDSLGMSSSSNVVRVNVTVPTISLTVIAGANGSVTPSGTFTYTVGDVYSFAAIPHSDYVLDHWDLAGINKGSSNPLSLTITIDMNGKTLTALFTAIPPVPVTVNIAVLGNGSTDLAVGSHTFNVGDTIIITATPQTGNVFDHWELDGTFISSFNPLELTVVLAINGATLTAVFVEIPPPLGKHYLTINSTVGGTTTPETGTWEFNEGISVLVRANPDNNYSFDHWELDGVVAKANPVMILMDKDKALLAVFTSKPVPIPLWQVGTLALSLVGVTGLALSKK
jgi:hypothetical protein